MRQGRTVLLPAAILAVLLVFAGTAHAADSLDTRTRELSRATLVCFGEISPEAEELLVRMIEAAYPAAEDLFGPTAVSAVPGNFRRIYVWQDRLFDIPALVAYSGAPFDRVNVANGGGAVSYGAHPGVYFSRARLLRHGYLDSVGVLAHEYAHILTRGLTAGRPLPSWFEEGIAEHARYAVLERVQPGAGRAVFDGWSAEVKAAEAAGTPLAPEDMDQWRRLDAARVPLAYAQSALMVEGLLGDKGLAVLEALAGPYGDGASFEDAWRTATGRDLSTDMAEAWENMGRARPVAVSEEGAQPASSR